MTIIVWPLDAVDGAPANAGQGLRQTTNAWAAGRSAARPLGARTGVLPGCGTLSSVTGAGPYQWSIGPHGGVLDVEASNVEGPYSYAVPAAVSGDIDAADATYDRKDLIYVQLSDPAAGDGSATPGAEILYTAGVPAAAPGVPATPAGGMAIAVATVPKDGTGAPSIVDVADVAVAAGGVAPSTGTLATLSDGSYAGEVAWTPDRGLAVWDGAEWSAPGVLITGAGYGDLPAAGDFVGDRRLCVDVGEAVWDGTHWVSGPAHGQEPSASNTDSSGYKTVTHGLGWTPALVVAQNLTYAGSSAGTKGMSTDSYTATSFRVRVAGVSAAAPLQVGWVAFP